VTQYIRILMYHILQVTFLNVF